MLPQVLKDYLEPTTNSETELETEEESKDSGTRIEDYPRFQGEWSCGTSIFGSPVMSLKMSNRIINDFITAVDTIEENYGRQVEKKEKMVEFDECERIKRVELMDEQRQFFQEVVDYHIENFGSYVGDRLIANASYQTWNGSSPIDNFGLDFDEPENLPITPQDRRDKVWLHVHCYDKAPESDDLRDLMDYFKQFENAAEYSSPTPLNDALGVQHNLQGYTE